MTVTSMFGSNVYSNESTSMFFVSSKNNASNETLYCKLINNTDVRKIVEYYREFSLGNIESLKTKLTLAEYNTLSVSLNNLKRFDNPNSCYELLRQNIVRSLESLMNAINIYNSLMNYKNNENNYEKWRNVYFNPVLLLERYNELQKNANKFFDDLIIEAPLLTLKPEYGIYIKKYGPPVNGIFESDKIAAILETLI
jgi:hypothetical protein